jgi:hypothetical protein
MPDNIVPISSANAPRYRYYMADLLTNAVIGEVSLEDVNYERSLKAPGSFDGKITITDQTNALDLYNATMPGKTALYAVRDGVCVWGGIIWGRTYDMVGRSLTVAASEFTSYLSHRIIWKAYSQSFTAQLSKAKNTTYVYVESVTKTLISAPAVGDKVHISFLPNKLRKYTGYYNIAGQSSEAGTADPGTRAFYVDMPKLPIPAEGAYPDVTITMQVDTYGYLKDIITNTLHDFTEIQFPNEEITPGIKIPLTVVNKTLVTTSTTNGVATLETSESHNLVVGQRVEIANVDAMLDGVYTVSEIPSTKTFRYVLNNPVSSFDNLSPRYLTDISTTAVTTYKAAVKYRQITQYLEEYITHVSRINGVVTLVLNSSHRFHVGDKIVVKIAGEGVVMKNETTGNTTKTVNSMDYIKYNNVVEITNVGDKTITFTDPAPDHSKATYNIPTSGATVQPLSHPEKNTVQLVAPKTLLKVFPFGGNHGFNINEQIQVSRVDGYTQPWTNPIFDGYAQIYEVSPGTLYTVDYYKVETDPNTDGTTVYDSDTIVTLYFQTSVTDDPGFKQGDWLTVANLTTDTSSNDISSFNGTYKLIADSAKDGSHSNRYYIQFKLKWDVTAFRAVTGATLNGPTMSVDGQSWIAYEPAYSEIKFSTNLKEPDATSNVKSIKYDPVTKNGSGNILTVNTTSRHNLNVGDLISISYASAADTDSLGSSSVEVISVIDDTTFAYSVPYSSKSTAKNPVPPTKKIDSFTIKSGLITRIKSVVGAPQPRQTTFTAVNANGNTVEMYSADHGLIQGDSVLIDVNNSDDKKYSYLENDKVPVTITDTTADTFSYSLTTGDSTTDSVSIRGISFQTYSGKDAIAFDIVDKGAPSSSTNYAITKIKPKWYKGAPNDNYVTYTTSVTPPAKGTKIDINGFTDISTSSIETKTVNTTINKLQYFHGGGTVALNHKKYKGNFMLITFTDEHGLPLNSGSDDTNPAKNKNTITISGFSTIFCYLGPTFSHDVSISEVNGKEFSVMSVLSSKTVIIKLTHSSNLSFYSIGAPAGSPTVAVANKNNTVATYKNLTQFNTAGTVDYVSGSTFAVKYDFLANKSGNGVSSGDSKGTEYTKSATATSYSKSQTSFTTGSVLVVKGIGAYTKADKKTVVDYSKFNGSYTIIGTASNSNYNKNADGSAASPKLMSTRVYVVNRQKDDKGKTLTYDNYPTTFDADFTNNKYTALAKAKMEKWAAISGTAYVDYSKVSVDTYSIDSVARTNANPNIAIIRSPNHGFEVEDYIEISVYGKYSAAFNQQGTVKQVISVSDDGNEFTYAMKSPTKISHYSVKSDIATLYFSGNSPHNYIGGANTDGDRITVSGVATGINGTKYIIGTGASTISFSVSGVADKAKTAIVGSTGGSITLVTARNFDTTNFELPYRGYAVPGAFIKRIPTVFSRTFGEFPNNASIGLDYSDISFSGLAIQNTPILGSSLNTVASILERYSNNINGFDYRIDCSLKSDSNGNKFFSRKFTLVPIYPKTMTDYLATLPDNKLAVGQWAPPAAFGADKVVFEYPGNITNVNMTESAQDSATRIFVSSSSNGSSLTEVKYSAASDTSLLSAGWPLLDKKESVSYPQPNIPTNKNIDNYGNYDIETDFHLSANRFLHESKPPQGDITISVNGSLTPLIGSYDPGDWCSIIINDNFVKNRLNSPLEPRKDIIVRKIDAIKVSVPNDPAFPEMIDLTLVPDWQVDTIGK